MTHTFQSTTDLAHPKGYDVWEKWPGESKEAFQAFRTYRDMGDLRTISGAAAAIGKSRSLLQGWATKWNWAPRVEAFDRGIEHQVVQARVEAITKAQRENVAAGRAIKFVSGRRIQREVDAVTAGAPLDPLSVKEAVGLFRSGAELEGGGLGFSPLPTAREGITVGGNANILLDHRIQFTDAETAFSRTRRENGEDGMPMEITGGKPLSEQAIPGRDGEVT
jgi:hypothetical protein